MKRFLVLMALAGVFGLRTVDAVVTPVVGVGKVTSIRDCGTGSTAWRGVTLFRLEDGKWFGMWSTNAIDGSNPQLSLVLLAYSKNESLSVRASYSSSTFCGITATMLWNQAGDYIHVGS